MFDPLDHPFVSLLMVTIIVLGLFFGFGVLLYYIGENDNPYNYRYIDVDGNEGYAQWCNNDSHLNCYTNKGYIQVKEFHKND